MNLGMNKVSADHAVIRDRAPTAKRNGRSWISARRGRVAQQTTRRAPLPRTGFVRDDGREPIEYLGGRGEHHLARLRAITRPHARPKPALQLGQPKQERPALGVDINPPEQLCRLPGHGNTRPVLQSIPLEGKPTLAALVKTPHGEETDDVLAHAPQSYPTARTPRDCPVEASLQRLGATSGGARSRCASPTPAWPAPHARAPAHPGPAGTRPPRRPGHRAARRWR